MFQGPCLGLVSITKNGITKPQNRDEAFKWYQKAANFGYPKAVFNLGVMYESGNGVSQNMRMAVHQYELAAELGVAEAMNNLGNAYHQGKGIDANPAEAVKWYTKADLAGFYLGPYNLGVMHYFVDAEGKDYSKAFNCFRKAADSGYAQAQYNLAGMYFFGEGTEKDPGEAFNFYSKAAEGGFTDAWKNLGDMYLNGEGVQKNIEKAILSFEKAADAGDDEARYELGRILFTTKGYQDFTKALVHLKLAAENSFIPAYNLLGVLLVSKKLSQRDPLAAWNWFEKAANEGVITAKLNQATYLKRGENGVTDYQKAFEILESIAQNDENEIASYLMALLILSGECEVKDQAVARKYLELSSQKGWLPAVKLLDNDDLFTGPAVLNFWEDYILEDEEE